MCCNCSMHVYSSALCLEWNDHSDVFFITEQRFLRLWCFTYGAIITICHLDAWSVANLQSFDACNNYYYWCHCTIFKTWTSLYKSPANRRGRQPVHTKAGNFLLVKSKPLKQRKVTSCNLQWGTDYDECKGSESRKVMQCVLWSLCMENSSGKLSPGVSTCHIPTICSWCLTLKLSHMSWFRQLQHLGLWVILSLQCVTGIQEPGVHSNHGFQTWLSRTPGSSPELSTALSWNLWLDNWGIVIRVLHEGCKAV